MFDVLRNMQLPDLISPHTTLKAYCERRAARPAFQKAMRSQLADFVPDPVVAAKRDEPASVAWLVPAVREPAPFLQVGPFGDRGGDGAIAP
jgi:hypothetical protein